MVHIGYTVVAAAVALVSSVAATPAKIPSSFGGASSYFLHTFPQASRIAVLDALKAADAKVVRIFISQTGANNKNTGSVDMPDIEPRQVGVWDDTQLEAIDQLMIEAEPRGIKLIIAMHDRYQLGCWGNDTYVTKYNLPAIYCGNPATPVTKNNVTSWYASAAAQSDFDNRMNHIIYHRNKLLGNREWRHLASHIFSFNVQNEGQGHLNGGIAPVPNWWCDKSKVIRKSLGSSNTILVSTGGGNDWSNSDIPENWACPTIDLVGLHSYDGAASFGQKGPGALARAKAAGKLVMVEEFGASGASKAQQIKDHIDVINGQLKMPWAIWEISNPGMGASDFEFFIGEPSWDVVKNGSLTARQTQASQDFSKYFYNVGGLELKKGGN